MRMPPTPRGGAVKTGDTPVPPVPGIILTPPGVALPGVPGRNLPGLHPRLAILSPLPGFWVDGDSATDGGYPRAPGSRDNLATPGVGGVGWGGRLRGMGGLPAESSGWDRFIRGSDMGSPMCFMGYIIQHSFPLSSAYVMGTLSRLIPLLLLLAFSVELSASWWWPFGKSRPRQTLPDPPPHGKYIPTDGDKSKKIYPKKDDKDNISVDRVKELAERENANAQLTLGKIYFDGSAGEKQDYRKAYHWFTRAAKNGNPEAMYNVAVCLEGGKGIKKANPELAFQWYKYAADHGVPEAQLKTAVYAERRGDPEMALKYYRVLADGGDHACQYQVALQLFNGYGAEVDNAQAAEYLLQAAVGGHVRAQVRLADCYQQGIGVARNFREVFHWLTLAAHDGDPEAQAKLGTCYLQGMGTPANPNLAFHWFQISAEGKYPTGEYLLGNCYRDGIGVTANPRTAFEHYLLAAEGGEPLAQFELYQAFSQGVGTRMDAALAREWLAKAAENGLAMAQAKWGILLATGEEGLPADPAKGREWLQKAQESQDTAALIQVALCHINGQGLPKDREKGRQLLQTACLNGDKDAAEIYKLYFGQEF